MGNDTYVLRASSEAEVVGQLRDKMVAWGIKAERVSSKLAPLYYNPKFHKVPVKFIFIASNVHVATSDLDSILARILKMLKDHFVNLQGVRCQMKRKKAM